MKMVQRGFISFIRHLWKNKKEKGEKNELQTF